MRHWHQKNSFRVRDECQPRSTLNDIRNGYIQIVGHETHYREHGKSSKNGREHICERYDQCIRVAVVFELQQNLWEWNKNERENSKKIKRLNKTAS